MDREQLKFDYDVAIIGGGSAGYAAARTSAAAGLKAVVIEGGRDVGGLCILRGCMPTKALLQAAEVRHLVGKSSVWGLQPDKARFDFGAVMARKDRLIREFADYRAGQLQDGRFEFIRSEARFIDPHRVRLADGRALTAAHFVVATGSRVAKAPLPSLESAGFLTSDDVLTLDRLPESVIVLGGGAVAVELAQFLLRFDCQVTLVQRSPRILRDFDPDASEALETALRREGMILLAGTRLLEAWKGDRSKGIAIEYEGRQVRIEAAEILYALGRSPNTDPLGLDTAGVRVDAFGRIVTDSTQQTSASHVYAAGDCTGPHEIVHIAIQQGEIAAHNIAHPDSPRAMDYRLLTSVVFTDPQVAAVGLTEKTARARNIPYLAASYPFNDHGKALILDSLDGFVKLLADPNTGEILGGAVVGPMGGELIHEIIAAMHGRMTVAQLAAMPHYHPTLAEIWTYPAEELAGQIGSRVP